MQELVSLVVPVYNVQKELPRCIDSLINQTYNNIEIILVDDGSTDESGKICDKYKKINPRIKVIHKKNGGLSDARNVGIENANGEYICFIDSDDYIEKDYVEVLYNLCIDNDAEISQCSYRIVKESGSSDEIKTCYEIKIIDNINALNNMYSSDSVNYIVAWNKLYKKELFNDIRFPMGKIHEDEFTTYRLLYKARKIAVTSKELYYYYYREGSITKSRYNIKRLDYIEALEERLQFYLDNNEKNLYDLTLKLYCYNLLISYYMCKKYISESKDISKVLLEKYRLRVFDMIKRNDLGKLKISVYVTAYILPYIIGKILNNRKGRNV